MKRTVKSVLAATAAVAFASVSFGAAEAGDCKHGNYNKAYTVTKNYNQPAKVRVLTLSSKPQRTKRKKKR